ncbi:MAG: DUF11 domain-containing protein, partial [Planctomycetes bacterium]|nr:DUF11 domain-containing protein [Planctomycetota bacterium]
GLTYTLTVTNVGNQGGTGVAVTDTLPAGIFTNVVAQNGGVFDAGAGTITWDLAAIAGGGASKTVTFTATVLNPTPTGVNAFTNTASVTDDGANGADPNLGNNTASDTDSLAGEPDYSITKSDGVASAAPGDGLTYTLTVTNAGNRGGSGVAVTDTLPAGIFTNVVAQNGGVFNAGAGTITWDLASIGGGGASKTVTFTATVVSPAAAGITSFTNTATVTDDGANGTDPNLANNTASDTDTLNAAPDYALTKSDGVAAVVPGDGLTYTLTVTNVGNQGGTGVAVTDTLPAGIFTNVVAQNGGVFNAGAGTITWDLAAIAGGGASKTVTFTATVLNPSAAGVNAFTNTATVADDGANGADPNLANNTARDTDALIATPDYSITKTDGVTAAAPGDGLTYTLTVTNVRNQGGTGVTVTDTLPTGIFTNVVAQNGGVFNAGAGTITWDLGELAGGGASKTVTFTATVLNPVAAGVSSFKNTATVTDDGANGADPNLANNTASDTDTLNAAPDYAITKTDGVGAAAPGDGLTYTLTVTNVGNQGGTGVAVTDNLPTGIFTNVVAQNGGVFNAGAGTITWDLGAIAGGGASKTVTFTATVVNPAAAGVNTFTNTATVTDDGANGADPNLANNTASDTDTLNAAPDYSITKTDGVGSAAPGDGLTYTLTVANLGNQGGTGVTVTDALPSGIFTNVVAQNGGVVNAGAGTITWDLAAIAGGGASKTVTFTATVLNPAAAGVNTFTNTATVTDDGANGTDPNLANNTASDTDTLNAAPDYALTKSDGVATATPGDGLTYTLTVTNIGNQGGTGVTVTDVLPSGIFTNVVAQNGGVVNAGAGTITWDLGAIAGGGATKSVTFTATVGNPAAAGVNNFTNTATVADDGANGADPNLANNTGSDTDTLNAAPDYSITKSDGVATAAPGGGLTYTLTVTNVGNQGGTGVVVTDVLPSGIFTNVVAQNGGVFDAGAGTITWALGSIAGGASTSVTFTASVVTPVAAGVETFTNTATVTDDGANGADPNGANNTASDTDTLLATPDYSIAKSDGVAATTPGGALTYTITVTNVGNQGGTGVVVTDVVPVNALTNIAAQNGGVFNAGAGTITWNLGALAGGASTSVTYTASVLTPAAAGIDTITNVATVADDGANGADPNAANNTASDTDTLNAAPDYAIAKSDGVASAAPGGGLTYTITVTNVGNQGGTGVVITDLVPVNVLGSIVAQNGGVFNAGAATITWNVGALAGGASTTVTYTASVLNPAASGLDSFTNTASVTDDGANGADPNAANNTASDTDALNAAPDYSLAKSDGVAVAAPGGGLTYTLTLTNVGNQGGTGIVVTDTLPVGLFTNVVAQNGGVVNAGAGTITWNVGALAGGGASTVVTFTATVVTPATAGVENFTNTATVADDGANGADPNAANNTATDTDTLHAAPDYAIAKTDNRATAAPGDALTYTITVTNVGNQGGTGVVVTDVVPVNALTNIVAQNGGVFNAGTGTITWNLGALAGGASSAVTYTATVITPAAAGIDTIANTATVADDGANGADPNAANNSVTDTDALDAAPDYSIVKSDGVAAAAPGGALTYTITVTNVGNQGGTGVVITDLVPTNVLTNIVAQNGGLFNEGAGTITWNLGALAGGASTTVTYTATVKSSVAAGIDAFTNTANATDDGANGADPNAANNTASDTDALNAAPDYSIAKSDGVATAAPGNALTYTLTITNVGNQDGTGVVVVDTFPTQVLESVVAANGGIVNAGAGTITWNLGALAAGASTTVTFTTNVKTPVAAGIANFTNNVTVTDDGANGADPNAANNAASDTDNLNAAPDYQITKTDNRAVAAPGDALTYTLVVTNVGNQDGTGVVVQDTFPTSVLAGVVAQNGGIVNAAAGTITWNVGALAGGGGSVTLTFTTTVTNPALAGINDFTNTVSATDDGANGADPNAANNTATDTDVLDALPDYRLTKTDNLTDVQAGQTVTYTVKVENLGNQGGTGVVVVDSFEPTFAGVSASDGGIVDATARTVTWNVGALPAGESRTFTVSGTVSTVIQVGIAAVTNTVVVTDDGQNGVDPNLADNRAEDADLITIRRNDVLPDNTFTSTRRPPEPFPVLLHLPLLPDMSPIYSGAADPGSVLEFAVQNSRGDTVGRQTVQVDAGGNWQVTFAVISLVEYDFSFGAFLAPDPRAPQPSQNRDLFESADVLFLDSGRGRTTKHAILDGPHELSIVQHPSLIDPGAPSGMNLRTYFAPAFNSGVFTYAPPGLEAVLSRAVVEVMARGNSNPLRVGFISYSAEFLCQSWIPTGG